METDLILQALQRIESKVDDAAVNAALAAQKADLLSSKVDDHIAQDREFHKSINSRVASVEHFRTSLKAKVGVYAAVVGFVVAVLGSMIKDAVASVFGH